MSKTRVVLNSKGIREMLLSDEIAAVLEEQAEAIEGRCGAGYAHDVYKTPGRVVASVYADTIEAVKDNLANNTILRALK